MSILPHDDDSLLVPDDNSVLIRPSVRVVATEQFGLQGAHLRSPSFYGQENCYSLQLSRAGGVDIAEPAQGRIAFVFHEKLSPDDFRFNDLSNKFTGRHGACLRYLL